jgi:hypothetical protein
MTEQMSIRDWERLSAYLDEDLEAGRRAKLEQRLGAEPALQRALLRLQRTSDLLRRAPQAQVPRSFTLTPEMAGHTGGWLSRLNLNLGIVSAVASLMLVVVLLGDLFSFGGAVDLTGLPGFAAVAPAPMEEESQAFNAEMADEQSADDTAMDGADADGPPEATALTPESADESLEERSLATADEEPAAAALDPWLLLEMALGLTALLAGFAAWRSRSSH